VENQTKFNQTLQVLVSFVTNSG